MQPSARTPTAAARVVAKQEQAVHPKSTAARKGQAVQDSPGWLDLQAPSLNESYHFRLRRQASVIVLMLGLMLRMSELPDQDRDTQSDSGGKLVFSFHNGCGYLAAGWNPVSCTDKVYEFLDGFIFCEWPCFDSDTLFF